MFLIVWLSYFLDFFYKTLLVPIPWASWGVTSIKLFSLFKFYCRKSNFKHFQLVGQIMWEERTTCDICLRSHSGVPDFASNHCVRVCVFRFILSTTMQCLTKTLSSACSAVLPYLFHHINSSKYPGKWLWWHPFICLNLIFDHFQYNDSMWFVCTPACQSIIQLSDTMACYIWHLYHSVLWLPQVEPNNSTWLTMFAQ